MIDVTDFPSRFICIFLPTSVALSPLTASSAVLVNPVEKDTSNCLSRSRSKGLFSSSHLRTSPIASVSRFICVLARSLWSGPCFLIPSSMQS